MRNRTAKDALARWLVVTAAGAGLVVLFPPAAFGGPSSVGTIAPMVHFIPALAVGVVAAAWIVFHLHVAQLRVPWRRDPAAITLVLAGALGVLATVASITVGWSVVLIGALVVTAGLHLALACRIDGLRRSVPARGRPA